MMFGMPIVFFFAGMRHLGAGDASTLSTLEPVVTLLLAYLFLGETLGLLQALGEGAAVSFFGLWELSRLAGAEPALARVSVVGHRLAAWALVAAVTVHLGLVAKQQGVPRDGPVRGRVPTQKKGAPEGAPGTAGTDDPT